MFSICKNLRYYVPFKTKLMDFHFYPIWIVNFIIRDEENLRLNDWSFGLGEDDAFINSIWLWTSCQQLRVLLCRWFVSNSFYCLNVSRFVPCTDLVKPFVTDFYKSYVVFLHHCTKLGKGWALTIIIPRAMKLRRV